MKKPVKVLLGLLFGVSLFGNVLLITYGVTQSVEAMRQTDLKKDALTRLSSVEKKLEETGNELSILKKELDECKGL